MQISTPLQRLISSGSKFDGTENVIERRTILPEKGLPNTLALLAEGRRLAKDWRLQAGSFAKEAGCSCEADYKRRAIAGGRVMQHAQIGYRDLAKSSRAWREIYEICADEGVTIDRYGVCLDWAMGLPRDQRKQIALGTGLILEDVEDFVRLADQAPVAPHFGDFVMGFPAAVENTQAALCAGASSIGNLGQYFTFRLPGWDDEIATTQATITAIALAAAQPVEVLIHSNLDDGFAALFADLASSLGAVLIEKHIVEDLLGARLSHCWGHHFTDPVRRLAFHLALVQVSDTPGTMIYGNTMSYRGGDGENYASLASYLLVDIFGQRLAPSGHAINPTPVRENDRIPEIDEIIEAQLFGARLIEHAQGYEALLDAGAAQAMAERIVIAGRQFFDNVMQGLAEAGIDTNDAVEILLAIRRVGGKRLEETFGTGRPEPQSPRGREPVVQSPLVEELEHLAAVRMERVGKTDRENFHRAKPRIMIATSDVHEHGKLAIEQVMRGLGVDTIDGGVSIDAQDLARAALKAKAQAILVSTYNGIALDYFRDLKSSLAERGSVIPVLIGGRINQIPSGSNTSLPVDVTGELEAEGAIVCREIEDAIPALLDVLGYEQ